ncbi:hypothetical protein ANN_10113 [Periplaneta americana]|uniref:Uncharacterized protein n=1 Tax=Periplaneta americana TaxID=6978 RepID=A0ABQ8TPQ1_PERAM|nr:hypothetical protein ANN_10113 [Periplaneta americana]
MAGLYEGGNESAGSLKAICKSTKEHANTHKKPERIPNLTGPVASVTSRCSEIRNKTAGRIDAVMATVRTHRHDTTVHDVIRLLIPALYKNQSDSLMAADGDCHHLCKLMAPVRHRWSINDVIGGIRNTTVDNLRQRSSAQSTLGLASLTRGEDTALWCNRSCWRVCSLPLSPARRGTTRCSAYPLPISASADDH